MKNSNCFLIHYLISLKLQLTSRVQAWNSLYFIATTPGGDSIKKYTFYSPRGFIKSTINYIITASGQLEFSQRQQWIRFDAFYSYEPQIDFTAALELRTASYELLYGVLYNKNIPQSYQLGKKRKKLFYDPYKLNYVTDELIKCDQSLV